MVTLEQASRIVAEWVETLGDPDIHVLDPTTHFGRPKENDQYWEIPYDIVSDDPCYTLDGRPNALVDKESGELHLVAALPGQGVDWLSFHTVPYPE